MQFSQFLSASQQYELAIILLSDVISEIIDPLLWRPGAQRAPIHEWHASSTAGWHARRAWRAALAFTARRPNYSLYVAHKLLH